MHTKKRRSRAKSAELTFSDFQWGVRGHTSISTLSRQAFADTPDSASHTTSELLSNQIWMNYVAPIKDILFDIKHLARIDQVAQMPGFEDAGLETAQAVLEECAKLNEGVIAPLNFEGDKNPSAWKDGQVTTTPGFKQAYHQYAEG